MTYRLLASAKNVWLVSAALLAATASASGELARRGPAALLAIPALVIVGALLVFPTAAFVAFLTMCLGGDYVSSWLPPVAGFPAGALIRDFLALLFLAIAPFHLAQHGALPGTRLRGLMTNGERRAFVWGFGLYTTLILALVIASSRRVPAVYSARDLLLYPLTGIVAFVLFARGIIDRRKVGLALLALGTGAAVLGILDSLTTGRILALLHYNPEFAALGQQQIVGQDILFYGYGRATGGVTNAVSFGYLMAALAVYACYRITQSDEGRRLDVLALESTCLIACTIACFLSLTRGAIIAIVLGIGLIVGRSSKKTVGVLIVLASVGLLAGVAGTGFLHVLTGRLTSSDQLSQLSTQARIDELKYGVSQLRAHPLGLGIESAGKAASRFAGSAATVTIQHNYFLAVGFELGLPGLFILWFMLGVLFRTGIRNLATGGSLLVAVGIVFALSSAVGVGGSDPVSAAPLWAVAALALSGARGVVRTALDARAPLPALRSAA